MLQVAVVNEAACIGCTACFQACPTGAIVGAAKHVHTVIPALCTGCNACVPVCPVPCLSLVSWGSVTHPLQGKNAAQGKALAAQHQALLAARGVRVQALLTAKPNTAPLSLSAELAAVAKAAREKSVQKYKKMGPLKQPRGLKR